MYAACNNLAVRALNRQLTAQEMEASERKPLFPDQILPRALVEEYEALVPDSSWEIGRHRFFSFLVMTLWAVVAFSHVTVWFHPPVAALR
jgi:hypothetical protein